MRDVALPSIIPILLLAILAPSTGEAQEGVEFFRQKIRPIFSSRCQGCHNDTLKFSGLSLMRSTDDVE
jgi:hypothetical protein